MTRPTDARGDGITEIFRKEALQRLSSPERLDQLTQVVGPHDWPGLATALVLLELALTIASSAEWACLIVTRAIRAALHKLRDYHPALGHHLATSVTPETFCTYTPDPTAPLSCQLYSTHQPGPCAGHRHIVPAVVTPCQ